MPTPATLAAIIITLCFAAGLNVYATIFSLGLMARLHWIVLPDTLHILTSLWVVVASGIFFAAEFVADKIPGFDLAWNALHTFIRIPVAALMAYAAGSHLSPGMHILVTCIGASIAAIAHSSKSALRVVVTPSPEPISNIALSTGEDAVAVGLSWLALHHAMLAGATVLVLSIACLVTLYLSFHLVKKSFRWLSTDRRGAAGATSITPLRPTD